MSGLPSVRGNTDPNMKDLLDLFRKDLFLSLNCHHLGTIKEFDPETQTATVTINYKKSYNKRNAVTGVYEQVLVDYPILPNVPVVVLKGGAVRMTMPIAAGDACILLFNDRDIDNWYSSGQVTQLNSQRLHAMADAIALVGLNSMATPIGDYDADRGVLEYEGGGKVAVGEDKVLIANADLDLKTLLQTLISQISDLVTQTALITVTCSAPASPSSPPINAVAISAIATDLASTASDIGDLLDDS